MNELVKTVYAILDDLFFSSKIKNSIKDLDINLSIIKSSEEFQIRIKEQKPNLIIIDLASKKIKTEQIIKELKNDQELKEIFCIGYLPHVEKELMEKFKELGCDLVIPRSRFSNEINELIQKQRT